jgi:YHS domain-containing protein
MTATKHFVWIIAVFFIVTGGVLAVDEVKELKAQTLCPVMGGKISTDHFVDYQGQRVYLCCAGCKATFEKDPETCLKKMAANGEKPEALALCGKCGEVKGTEVCCAKDAEICSKCNLHKGSPGCCAPAKAITKSGCTRTKTCAKTCAKAASCSKAKSCDKPCTK